jgi:hypothetical protein
MAVVRGFVQKIEVGRAGLVQVTVVHADGTAGVYVIRDLDADPERFNERLSKLAVLRDAMDRAEPVEIEHEPREGANEIQRAVRISRDELTPVRQAQSVRGLVVSVGVTAVQGIEAGGTETGDAAEVILFVPAEGLRNFRLPLQVPERQVAIEQLRMLREAEAQTRAVVLAVEPGTPPRIFTVVVEDAESVAERGATEASGFVESLSLIRLPAGGTALAAAFAHVRFTTAPDFTGPGNTVGNAPFTPVTLDLLVPKNSLVYELFEAGLRDNLRMRVRLQGLAPSREPGSGTQPVAGAPAATAPGAAAPRVTSLEGMTVVQPGQTPALWLALAAELLAPLASASRPVWVNISRESLDRGPEHGCAEGVPSSDLGPKTLRDLKIPYTAVWKGCGCFNEGVYRIQVETDAKPKIRLDGRELCVHDSDNPKVKFAYACLEEDHCIEVELEDWTCDKEFLLDVYRLR